MDKYTLPNLKDEQTIMKSIRIKQGLLNRVYKLSEQTNIPVNRLITDFIEHCLNNLSEDDIKKAGKENRDNFNK